MRSPVRESDVNMCHVRSGTSTQNLCNKMLLFTFLLSQKFRDWGCHQYTGLNYQIGQRDFDVHRKRDFEIGLPMNMQLTTIDHADSAASYITFHNIIN